MNQFVEQDISLGYPSQNESYFLDDIVNPFTIIVVPNQLRIYTSSGVSSNSYNPTLFFTHSLNPGNFVPIEDVEIGSNPRIRIQEGIYFWRFAKMNEILDYLDISNQEIVYDGTNNFANNVLMSQSLDYSAILVLENYFDINQIERYFELASVFGCNFYFDTGLSNTTSSTLAQCGAARSLRETEQIYMFAAINTPPLVRTNYSLAIDSNYFNMFITSGYVAYKAKGILLSARDEYLLSGESGNLRLGGLKALVPASALYAARVIAMYQEGRAYQSIMNKNVGYLIDGIDTIYKLDDISILSSRGINPLYLKPNGNLCFMSERTPATLSASPVILRQENASRLSIDIAREIRYQLSYLIGVKKEEEEIKEIISSLKEEIFNRVIRFYELSEGDFFLEYKGLDQNKLEVNAMIRFPGTIEFVKISTVVV